MKVKLKTATRQLDQLKDELKEKDAALEKAHVEHEQSENEKESLKVRPLTHVLSCKGWIP